jgi:hypothetical protein
MVNNGAPLCNTSINGTTKKAYETKFFYVFHQNIRQLRGKANKLLSHLHPSFPHILCLTEHHMSLLELQQLNIDFYKLSAKYCRTQYGKEEYAFTYIQV